MIEKNRFEIESYSFISYNNYTSPIKSARGIHIILADDNPFSLQIESKSGERLLRLAQGDVCIVFDGVKYHFSTMPDIDTRILTLELSFPPISEDDGKELAKLLNCDREYLIFSGTKELRELMLLLQRCHETQYRSGNVYQSVALLAKAFLCRIAEEIFGRQLAPMLCAHTRKAISYISKNYKSPITLGLLCAEVGIGERRMQKLFREELSTTFVDYLTDFRISKACDLLRSSNATIEAIAELIGYNSRQHFTHVFKQKLGQSPQQFRTAVKKRNYRYTHADLSSIQDAFISFEGAIVE